jgi:ribonuclease HIII
LNGSGSLSRPEGDILPRAVVSQWGEGAAVGPAVVTTIYLDALALAALSPLDLSRWPDLDEARVGKLARRIAQIVPYESVILPPRRWNILVKRLADRDRVLNWAYRRSLSTILEKYPDCRVATFDSYSPGFALVEGELPGHGRAVLVYRPTRSPDVGQAAAGVLARGTFIRSTSELARRLGLEPPGPRDEPALFLTRWIEEKGEPAVLTLAKRDDARVQAALDAARTG